MKAGLPQKEPAILARWEAEGLYQRIREARAGREKFIFHDGPPYANGDIHIGHALNHTIKDMVVRTQTLLGKDAPYVPGWDCHGLPIEWKVEEQYRKKKLNKDEVPVREFRAECRAYAQHWVDVQREQLKRLGVSANWDKPYLTMNYHAEATIVSELFKFAETGQLYRGAKPVMWSPVEKTALAEAEIEYEDIVSTQIDVAFEIVESPIPELVGAHAVVWTTTPWTIPVNQAIAYNPEVEYCSYDRLAGESVATTGRLPNALVARRTADAAHLVATRSSRRLLKADIEPSATAMAESQCQRLRPRRHHRPPPDAQARRLLRQAAAVPAGRLRHHRPGHRPRPHGARPWRGRFRAVPRATASTRCSRSMRAASTGPTGCGSAGRAASSTPSSTRPTGRSARTCARRARCSRRARTSSTATRIRGGRRPRSSTAARRNGSSRWTSRCRSSPARRGRSRGGRMRGARL